MQRSLLVALLVVSLGVAGAQAPVECDGQQIKDVPSMVSPYVIGISKSALEDSLTSGASIVFAGLQLDVVSTITDPAILKASLSGDDVAKLAAAPGVEYIECDGKAEISSTPTITCNGFEMPISAGRYMVTMKGDWNRQQLSDISAEITQVGIDKGAADYYEAHNSVPMISMFSGTFSALALTDLIATYGSEIDYIECDSMATIAKTKLYCLGKPIDAPLDALVGYTISTVDTAAAASISQQLTTSGVPHEDAKGTSTSSVEVLAFMTKDQAEAVMEEFGSSINYMKCEVARQPPVEPVPVGDEQPAPAGQPAADASEPRAAALDGLDIDGEDDSSAMQLATRSAIAAALLLLALAM